MKKFSIFFLYLAFIIFSPIQSFAENANNQSQNYLQSINQEINSLEKKLAAMRKKALNQEMQAQPYMIDNWHEFAEDIQHTEESEKAIITTKKKLKEMYKQKENILNQHPSQ